MRLTQTLWRKRKMITKPQSYVRNWMWNNSWYLNQERPVKNFKIKEALLERNIPIYTADELLSPILPGFPAEELNLDTRKGEQKRDETHPLWKDEPAYTYSDRSWQPKDSELVFAQALTNTVATNELPEHIEERFNNIKVSGETERRVENLIKSCYIGDAVQEKLPRNFRVPFIGWHPVESRMMPRNQYDWQKFSYGWKLPREYGIPNKRKVQNLTRGLFKEMCKHKGISFENHQCLEDSKLRQFIRGPDGKLIRFYLSVPFAVVGSQPLDNYSQSSQDLSIPDISPLTPTTGLRSENVYELVNNYPIKSRHFSHPHIQTVVHHYTTHIDPQFREDKQKARCLIQAYTAALGQARLLYGEDFSGDLTAPITVNSIATDGAKYIFSCFQLNSLSLTSSKPNLFSCKENAKELFEFCGYDDARVSLRGLNMDTYRWLEALLFEDKAVARKAKISI